MTEQLIKNTLADIIFEHRICESLEDYKIINYLYEELLLDRLLYGEPVTVPELRKLLHKKIINFEFIKLNGDIRPAKGTTLLKYVPQSQHPKGIRPSSPKVAVFYDIQKKDWRSVSQRSKEIVLKKDETTGKPVVMVKDKPKGKEIAPTTTVTPKQKINVGDIFDFTKITKVKYQSGDTKQYHISTFIIITKKDEEGYWGKTSGSKIPILLNPERMKRLGDPLQIGDEYQYAEKDNMGNKNFTTIKIVRKTSEGYWGKTPDSKQEILLTPETLKNLHKYVNPEEERPIEPTQPTEPIEPEKPKTITPSTITVKKVKPIESTEIKKMFHFVNPKTGASQHIEMAPKEAVKQLKKMGKDWKLADENEVERKEKNIEKLSGEEIPIKPLSPKELKTKIKPKDIINKEKNKDLDNIEADEL